MASSVEYLLLIAAFSSVNSLLLGLVQIGHVHHAVTTVLHYRDVSVMCEVVVQQSVMPMLRVEHNTHQFCCFKSIVDEIYQRLN